ncbi:tRNA uridine 5-carboxymethylaminomethyl modification enzyme MnmG [Endomicrobiia bacterium]|nr:tRNA uridine 5-carboxymethylaminomethyl modification enzyme MnmG [Endomicrobiia bacterium]GHT74898.1 tRNA uridine 5-carboxymethylaminomethyl modification enzyme MnmG [Endomicrobiia bacterium]
MERKYQVVIIGAGHAGCEASLVCARMGLKTLVLTLNVDSIARMPCNPAIGGIAKGQMVREIDAIGGEMGQITDRAGLQFKMLNSSRGPAVWSPRAQCDKELYSVLMSKSLQNQSDLEILQSEATSLIVKNGKVCGVKILTGETINADAVVVTTGTFLNGAIHLGKMHFDGGRFNERPASYLSISLAKDCGLKLGRFKTTTTPRINTLSIDYSKMTEQLGDEKPKPFSHFTEIKQWRATLKQLPCWLTYTNTCTHKIVEDNLGLSSINIGEVNSKSPRYCPAIEEKIERYPEKTSHHIFVEPEGYNTNEVYLNGLYTGLPFDLQQKMINSIAGLEDAKVIRYGYAIEYDYSSPLQIKKSLETKTVENLFLGGQINGTTGYEEAASQGFVAGVNAGLKVLGKAPLILGRNESYVGILIDDITTKGVDEPYRMFTSRAEYRLSIRNDNADLRLMDIGRSIGLISDKAYEKFELYRNTLADVYENNTDNLPTDKELSPWSFERINEEIFIHKKYEGYIEIQDRMANKMKKNEDRKIPEDFDYSKVDSFSSETKQRLMEVRPQTIGQASRIHAVKPSDIAILTIYLEKRKREESKKL